MSPTKKKNKNPKRGRQCVMDGEGREAVAILFSIIFLFTFFSDSQVSDCRNSSG